MCLVIIACTLTVTSSQQSLLIEPKETIAVRGENITLTCHFATLNTSQSDDRFWWLRPDHNFRFVRNEAVLLGSLQRERYSVRLDRDAGTYSLTIRKVQLLDGGKFMCSYRRDRAVDTFSSETATMTVLSPPPGGYPRCPYYTKSNLILSPSKRIALTCPKVDSWNVEPDTRQNQRSKNVYFSWGVLEGFLLQNGTSLLSYSSRAPSGEGTFCMTDHPILGRYPDRCSLVHDAESAVVLIQPAGVHIRVGENMTFACKVNSAIEGVRYEWIIPSNLPSERIQINQEGSRITVINVQETEQKINPQSIGCTVTLEDGKQINALANVTVIPLHGRLHVQSDRNVENVDLLAKGEDRVIPGRPTGDEEAPQKSPKNSFKEFVTNPEKMAIVFGPSLAVIIFFVLFYALLRFAVNKKVTVVQPPRIVTTSPDAVRKQSNTSNPETAFQVPAFSRSYSDATSYRFSRNFDIHNSFQEGDIQTNMDCGERNVPNVHHSTPRADPRMNVSMPSLQYKSNTLPSSKSKRSQDLPPPPNSFIDLPHEVAKSSSYLELPSVDWRPKRSVHFAKTPPKQMKKVKK